ncbi:MAG: hypothetical protein IIA44_13015 [Acidobacteria bacterium]|nr:hypothetical protein [Acidobacteriota bacterium]
MLFKSQILTQASGSIGGITASHNRGGMYFRARAIPTDPNTPAQATIRSIFSALVDRWSSILTSVQRGSWDVYADLVPLPGPLGDPITVSGFNHFVRSNVPRSRATRPIVDTAPPFPTLGLMGLVAVTSVSAATQAVTFTFDDTDLWNVADGFGQVQHSRGQNNSINFFRGPYRQAGFFNGDGPAVSPAVIAVPFVITEGQNMFFRVRASFPDGKLTAAQFIGPVIVVA